MNNYKYNQCLNSNNKILTFVSYLYQELLTKQKRKLNSSQINKQKTNLNTGEDNFSPFSNPHIGSSIYHNGLARQTAPYAKIQDPNWILKFPNRTKFKSFTYPGICVAPRGIEAAVFPNGRSTNPRRRLVKKIKNRVTDSDPPKLTTKARTALTPPPFSTPEVTNRQPTAK